MSWKYYIGGLNRHGAQHAGANDTWCSICNPLQYSKNIMTTALRKKIVDVSEFYDDAAKGTLPEVSFVRPYEPYSGHPANSAVSAYEYFVLSIANNVISRPDLFASTAIVVTLDEGGGYYDSGYIQPLDFFGDGTRIPMLVISPFVKARHDRPHLFRPRIDLEVHREKLGTGAAVAAESRQFSQSDCGIRQSLRSDQRSRYRRSDDGLRLRSYDGPARR